MTQLQNHKPVVLHGLFLNIHIPTEERLNHQIEGLGPEAFRRLAADLEDYFAVVDDKYKETAIRGRGWKGRGKKVSAGIDSQTGRQKTNRVRVLRFSPFPSRFSNILRTMRRDLYDALHRECLVLEGNQRSRFKQNIYVLPFSNAPVFMSYVAAKNNELVELQQRIEDFKQTRYFNDIKDVLAKYNIELHLNGSSSDLGEITVDATPLALETSTVKQMVEDEYKQMFEEAESEKKEISEKLRSEYEHGMQALTETLERQRKEIVEKAVQNVAAKINLIVKRIVGTKKLKPESVKKDLDRLRRMAVSVGLDGIASSVIDPLIRVSENPDEVKLEFGTNDLEAGVSGRIRGLLKGL